LIIAKSLGFSPAKSYEPTDRLCADVSRMLIAMMNKLKG
jgi:hypothetical protein